MFKVNPERTVASLGLVIGLLVLIGWFDISPPLYEPLGAGAIPLGAGVLLLVTSVVLIGSSVLRRYVDPSQGVQDQDFLLVPEPLKVFATIGALAVYIVLFNSDIGFRWATFLFILSAGWILGVRRRRDVILLIALASMTAVGCHYLFTQVFVVDIA